MLNLILKELYIFDGYRLSMCICYKKIITVTDFDVKELFLNLS